MTGVRLSRPDDMAALKEIWSASFPGDEAFSDWFLHSVYAPENALVFEDGGRAAAMLHLLPARLRAGGEALTAAYVYAVATLPPYRGKGVAAALLGGAEDLARARGASYLVLVPQSESLFEYYRRQGFETAFFRGRRTIAAGGPTAPDFEIDDAPGISEMDECFEAALSGRDHVARSQEDWARSLIYLRALGVRRAGRLEGYAVYEPGGGVRELVAKGDAPRCALEAAALDRLGVREAACFTPEGEAPYGMARALRPAPEIRAGYAGLMLD
jgi:GNAT superfamily N-acetyltransferase